MLIGRNPKEEFEKVGFPVFAILRKKIIGGSSNIEMFEINAMFVIKQNIRHKDHMTPKTWVLNFVLFMFYMAGMTAKNP